jgi:hypothetical protein
MFELEHTKKMLLTWFGSGLWTGHKHVYCALIPVNYVSLVYLLYNLKFICSACLQLAWLILGATLCLLSIVSYQFFTSK